ncbi:Uncharacterised protein [Anaerobiospirillum thomasii]|uniref:Uncharacterized protein n=1 Tax=Anaerobiospirillum thomasii TaxID=179995 RepID=A0A2X0VJK2_9GAMM|nr:hypothetical protein [Anaerobiospirillum thomasii]SPT67880.1 Uncharacterised protein [Anaerobiospirillum thomasii]SPT70330.1 Uncharacterised protein [Anaerobiospirillum thomasii]
MSFDMIYSVLARRNFSPKDLIFRRRVAAAQKSKENAGADIENENNRSSLKESFARSLNRHIDETV